MNAAPLQPPKVHLSELIQDVVSLTVARDPLLCGITLDSRRTGKGDLFMACKGADHDGRDYIDNAIAGGASAILVEQDEDWKEQVMQGNVPLIPVPRLPEIMGRVAARFYGEPAQAMRMVGITGTNGKTTTCHLTARLFSLLGYRCGVIGTLGYGALDGPLTHDSGVPSTTPDAVSLQRQLAGLNGDNCDTVVMEVSSHGLDQYRVNIDEFSVAVFTNLTRDHLDYHGSMERYADAKRRLFTGRTLSVAVLNEDDPWSRDTRKLLSGNVNCLSWSLGNVEADVCCRNMEFSAGGMMLEIATPWGVHAVRTTLLGSFNASNLMAALTTVLGCESGKATFNAANIINAIAELRPVTGRMQRIEGNWPVEVVIDYAHTPDGLEKALTATREHCKGRLWVVFGCGGNRDRGKRPQMAAVAEANADMVVLTNDNPRDEEPLQIIRDMQAGLDNVELAIVEPDRSKAISYALSHAGHGDAVLVAGKGHESWQEIAGQKIPFNDAEVAAQLLLQQFDPAKVNAGERS